MSRTQFLAAAAFAVTLAAPALAHAQSTGGYPPGTPVAEIERRERAETERLNNEVLARDAQVVASNEAAERDNAAAAAAAAAAEADYAAQMARHQAEVDAANEAQRRYEADMAAWRARTGRPG